MMADPVVYLSVANKAVQAVSDLLTVPVSGIYEKSRPLMQTGDCILWKSRSAIGWLIRMFSRGEFNHAGLVVRPDDVGCFSGRRFTLEALGSGIVLRLLSERLRNFKGEAWLYPLREGFSAFRPKILDWAMAQEGTPYDYDSLFKQMFGKVSVDMKEYFCSEFVYAAWLNAGMAVHEKKAPRPGDIPAMDLFNDPVLIHKG